MRRNANRWPRIPALYGAGIGFGTGIVVTIASSTADATNGLIIMILTVAAVSSLTTVVGALATALQIWLLYAGFVINHAGQVALNGTIAVAALVLAGTAIAATAVGAAIRWFQMPYAVRVSAVHRRIASSY